MLLHFVFVLWQIVALPCKQYKLWHFEENSVSEALFMFFKMKIRSKWVKNVFIYHLYDIWKLVTDFVLNIYRQEFETHLQMFQINVRTNMLNISTTYHYVFLKFVNKSFVVSIWQLIFLMQSEPFLPDKL